jgi:DNA mismatch repair protein MutL
MSKINILDEATINKIAAGEVIERPSSVVKELVENSLDANATQIIIEIKKSGKDLIKVTDNGDGMPKEDALLAFKRHTTSKINHSDDLFNINTLGFRGEALASIASVSHTTLITKERNSVAGFHMDVIGGIMKYSQERGCPSGTTMEVKDLFFNTPARKKFMKTETNELRHIIDIVTRYALINKDTSFKLTHNNNTIIQSDGNQNLLNNIASIYGNEIAKDLLKVDYKDNKIKIAGYISKPSQTRTDKSQQSIYINNRYVKSTTVSDALYDAYHSLLFVNRHPVCILNIDIDPEQIDVNVHPNKSIIKFEQTDEIYNSVLEAAKQVLEENNLIVDSDIKTEEAQMKFSEMSQVQDMDFLVKPTKYQFEPSKQTLLSEDKQTEHKAAKVIEASRKFPRMKLLGQINKTFFVAETNDGMMLIDQHVVEERVLYEKFMAQHIRGRTAKQSLLNKEIIEVTPEETTFLNASLRDIEELGFEIEHFGDNTFLVRSVPVIFKRIQTKELLKDIITTTGKRNKVKEIKEEIITRMACRASIKAGDTVSIQEMETLIRELTECRLPYTCPHGRPIFIKITADELEKKFKRK